MQIKAGLFNNFLHANSAELAVVEWNEDGTKIVRGPPGDDADWAVGEGSEGRWEDQVAAVKLMLNLGTEIAVEHDIDSAGEDPMECFARSRANFDKMVEQSSA
jgi:hypothetical protein